MRNVAGDLRKLHFDIRSRLMPSADNMCQTKNGLMTFSSKDRSIGRRLYARREWSCDEGLLRATDNDLFINVGANIGCSDLVGEMCSVYYCKQDGQWRKSPLTEFRALYDRYDSGIDGTDIVLLTR